MSWGQKAFKDLWEAKGGRSWAVRSKVWTHWQFPPDPVPKPPEKPKEAPRGKRVSTPEPEAGEVLLQDGAPKVGPDAKGPLLVPRWTFKTLIGLRIARATKGFSRVGFGGGAKVISREGEDGVKLWETFTGGSGGIVMKEGSASDQAIVEIFEKPQLFSMDCGNGAWVVTMKAILDCLIKLPTGEHGERASADVGREKFNREFPYIHLARDAEKGSFKPTEWFTLIEMEDMDYKLGDYIYIDNPDFDVKLWQGESAFLVGHPEEGKLTGETKVWGHGLIEMKLSDLIKEIEKHRKKVLPPEEPRDATPVRHLRLSAQKLQQVASN